MDVLVTGSSGLIGRALVPVLEGAGHRVLRLGRRGLGPAGGSGALHWDPDAGTIDAAGLEGLGGVVHLAGEGIGEKRWTPEQKQRILESRTRGTDLIARTLVGRQKPPTVLVSASAIGYYGSRGDELLRETSAPGDDFLADLCVRWEAATAPAVESGIRVVTVRTGIVLSTKGGALARMVLPFKLGLGGKQGRGSQYMSWIALVDEVRAITHCLERDTVVGPVNLTAPEPVTNREFAATLGRALHRPAVLPTPLLPLRLRYGSELVEHLLLASQRAVPEVLASTGFEFVYPDLAGALGGVLADA